MDTVLGWSHVQTTSLKALLGPQLRICRAPGQVRRSHRFVGDRVLTIVAVHSMAILGGVDGTNDELGCQKTARIQKGVWKGLPPPEEGYDTVFILNCVIHRFCEGTSRRLLKVSLGSYPLRNSSSVHAWSP